MRKIIVIDDDKDILGGTASLAAEIYPAAQILQFSDWLAAVEEFGNRGTDLVITDFRMPPAYRQAGPGDTQGKTVAEFATAKMIPVVVMSSDIPEGVKRNMKGVVFLQKPFTKDQLEEAVLEAVHLSSITC